MSRYDTEWLQAETVVSLWDRISRQCRDQCQRHLRGYLACILGRTFETLRTLISGPFACVSKLTRSATAATGQKRPGYWSHRQCDARIVAISISAERRLMLL